MSAEKKASTALARAHAANDNITEVLDFLKNLPMILSLDDQHSKVYKKAFDDLQKKIH